MPCVPPSLLPRRLGNLFWVAVLWTAVAAQALAQPSAQDRERARSLMDVGDAKYAAQDYAAALKAYQAADAIMGVPTTGLEVGRALSRLGRLIEARDALIVVTRYPRREDEPKPFTAARQAAEGLAAELAARIPEVTFELTGLPAGVEPEVSLDGERLASTLLGVPIKVNPGTHQMTGRAAGFQAVEREIAAAEGASEHVEIAFLAEPVPELSAGRDAAESAPAPQRVRPGRAWMWSGFGLAAAGAVVGSVTGILSWTKTRGLKDDCPGDRCSASSQAELDRANVLANVSNVALALGAVGAGVGLWQLFATRRARREQSGVVARFKLRAEPMLGPGRAGVLGSF